MKNRIIYAAMMLCLAVLIGACNQQSSSSSSSGDKVRLEMNVSKGDVNKLHYKIDQDISQKIQGQSMKIGQVIEMFIKQEVLNVSGDGIAEIRVTYERVKMEQDNPMMGKMSYDSNEEYDEVPMLGIAYEGMIGKSFTMKMDKRAKVTELEGIDALYDGIVEAMGDRANGPGMEDAMESVKKSFGEEAMRRNMQQMTAIYPDVLIGEGDTWGAETKMAGEYPLGMTTTYKVDHVEAKSVVLGIDGKIGTTENAKVEVGGMSVEYHMEGTQGGTMEMDRGTGFIANAEMTQDINGNMKMMGMDVPMTISSKITIAPY